MNLIDEKTFISDIIEILKVDINPTLVDKDTKLINSGIFFIDSIDFLDLLLDIEKKYGIELTHISDSDLKTIGDLLEKVNNELGVKVHNEVNS